MGSSTLVERRLNHPQGTDDLVYADVTQSQNPPNHGVLPARKRVTQIPGFGAKLPMASAQVANLGWHPPNDPGLAAKAGQPARNGHCQNEAVNPFWCHATIVTRVEGVATRGRGSTRILRQAQGRFTIYGAELGVVRCDRMRPV